MGKYSYYAFGRLPRVAKVDTDVIGVEGVGAMRQ